ncbi:MAG: hypothetical protein AAF487_11670 [Bacteroidota bacterium]
MRPIFLLYFISFFQFSDGQDIRSLAKACEVFLSFGTDIIHEDHQIALSDLELNETELGAIPRDILDASGDSINAWDLKYHFLELGLDYMQKILEHPDILNHKIEDLFWEDSFAVSEDSLLYSFVIPENHGGTYQSAIGILHYRNDKKVYNDFDALGGTDGNSDGYYTIKQIKGKSDMYYLLIGGTKTCGSCTSEYIDLVSMGDHGLENHFSYLIDGYYNSYNGIYISEKSDSLIIREGPGTYDYPCEIESDEEEINADVYCEFTYVFNGESYALIEKKVKYEYRN